MAATRVFIVDDDQEICDALTDSIAETPDLEVVGMATNPQAMSQTLERSGPDVIVMDVRLPNGGGGPAVELAHRILPTAAVVALSAYEDHSTVLEMVVAGAIGYVVKGTPEPEMLEAIRRAAQGQPSIGASLGTALLRDLARELEERTRSESTLRGVAEKLDGLLQAAPDALVMVDASGRIELVNAQTERLFGYHREELLGQQVEMLLPGALSTAHVHHRATYMAEPATRPMGALLDLLGRRKDGTEFPVDISLSPLQTDEGTKAVAAVRDITERRRVEDLRDRSERWLRGLLESAPDAMVIVDAAGMIQAVNVQTEKLFGYDRPELIGRSVDLLLPERWRGLHGRHRDRYLRDPRTRPMGEGRELMARRLDGSEFPVDISLSPLETDEGRLVVAAVRDISERKRSETELAQSQQEAESQRLFSQLVRAQEEERLTIASDIHDDTIQAMTAVGLRIQQLRRHLDDKDHLGLLDKLDHSVHESIIRLRRLMFDLRPPALDRTGLKAALRDLLDRVQEDSGLVGVLRGELIPEPSSEARTVLYRIAQEAVANVRKHAQAGRVEIELTTMRGGHRVQVADDGMGFDSKLLDRPGHLGIVAMRERARIARGWWRMLARPGGGTLVEFWIPADDSGEPAGPAAEPESVSR